MKLIKTYALAALACLSMIAAPMAADAAAVVSMARTNQINFTSYQSAQAAAADYTNATTSATDISEATVTVPSRPNRTGATEYYEACFYAQAIKATSTTGSIDLVVNGSAVTVARRTIDFGTINGVIVGCHTAAVPVKTSFIVKLQGVSGDTAVFTVSDAHIIVRTFFVLS